MSWLASVVNKAQEKAADSRSKGVAGHVRAFFDRALNDLRAGREELPEFFKRLPEIPAGQLVEARMLAHIDFIEDQLRADHQRFTRKEVCRSIVEAVRDRKIQSLEADNCVNPKDWVVIKIKANDLQAKARNYLLQVRMETRDGGQKEDVLESLDGAEVFLVEEASRECGQDYATFQRAAQAAIWAIGELRLQRLNPCDS